MSFLFADLPSKTYHMTEEQLFIWQRSAIFECECDNLINQHIEQDDRQQNRQTLRVNRRTYAASRSRMDAALDAAISTHGLRLNNNDPMSLRNHGNLLGDSERLNDRNIFDMVMDTSYSAAMRYRGLNLRRSP